MGIVTIQIQDLGMGEINLRLLSDERPAQGQPPSAAMQAAISIFAQLSRAQRRENENRTTH